MVGWWAKGGISGGSSSIVLQVLQLQECGVKILRSLELCPAAQSFSEVGRRLGTSLPADSSLAKCQAPEL